MVDLVKTGLETVSLFAAILGVIAGTFVPTIFKFLKENQSIKRFRYQFSTAQRYWIITALFIISVIALAILILIFVHEDRVAYLTLLVESSTLIFAAYVGYFAFEQLNLAQRDQFTERKREATALFNKFLYEKAIKEYEAIYSLKFEFYTVSEQTECYACLKDWPQYEYMLKKLKEAELDGKDALTIFYLKSLKPFVEEELGKVKQIIKEAIAKRRALGNTVPFDWQTSEIENSEGYKAMETVTKDLFQTYVKYLRGELKEEERVDFEKTYS